MLWWLKIFSPRDPAVNPFRYQLLVAGKGFGWEL